MLTESERHQSQGDWDTATQQYPVNRCVHSLFEQQAGRTPDAAAVVCEDKQLTYRELNQRANQVAHYLRKLGVGPEVPVGICMDRTLDLMVGLLGILKAGGAYLPLDPDYPKTRLEFMLDDVHSPVLLTQKHLAARLPKCAARTVCVDTEWHEIAQESQLNLDSQVNGDNLAYIIFTSGSTGKPKGAMIRHSGLTNYLNYCLTAYPIAAGRGSLVHSSIAFDATITGLYAPLLAGRSVYLLSKTDDLEALANTLRRLRGFSVVKITPAHLSMLNHQIPPEEAAGLTRAFVIGGENLVADQIEFWQTHAPETLLFNEYGPTETVVGCIVFEASQWRGTGSVPIGKPISNTVTFVLSGNLQPVPVGETGELYIGGAGVARGYWNRAQLTDEKFILNPFSSDSQQRLYQTGDRVRFLPDGNLEFIGRVDNQVKIHGFRIELGEIEATLNQHPAVRESVALVQYDASGDPRLVAYCLPRLDRENTQGDNSLASFESQAVTEWQTVFEQSYRNAAPAQEDAFDIAGWNSSYTGELIAAGEMREWLDATCQRILLLKPRRIFEIGCGTGMIVARLAPQCEEYFASDFSQTAVASVQKLVARHQLSSVRVSHRIAHEFADIPERHFDTIVLNSVAQHFPSIDYLLQVIENSMQVLAPNGNIFVGDVRSLGLLEAFHTSVQLFKAPNDLSVEQLRDRIRQQINAEQQLVIDPGFFTALVDHLPGIESVEILPKRERSDNELTKYRYDVVIQAGPRRSTGPEPQCFDWQSDNLSIPGLHKYLKETNPDAVIVTGVPNARVLSDLAAVAIVNASQGAVTVGELKQSPDQITGLQGVAPEDLWNGFADLPYDVSVQWPEGKESVQVAFYHRNAAANRSLSTPLKPGARKSWQAYGNHPLQASALPQIEPELRKYLSERLPASMMPSAFILLDRFPLTTNGKVDRTALPVPDWSRQITSPSHAGPRNEIEETLVRIWQAVLKLERVGIRDNFFDVGGHSLSAVRVHARMREELQIDLPIRTLLQHPTIEALARPIAEEQRRRYSSNDRGDTSWKYLREFQAGTGNPPVFMIPGGLSDEVDVDLFFYARIAHFVGPDFPFYGLRPRGSDGKEEPHRSVKEMAKDYLREIRFFQPKGPYFLTGACIGGAVAYEMACQLEALGEEIGFLGLLDTVYPRVEDYLKHCAEPWVERYNSTKLRVTDNYYANRLVHHWRGIRQLGWKALPGYLTDRSVAALSDIAQTLRDVSALEPDHATGAETAAPKISEAAKVLQRTYGRALRRYRPRRYRGKLTQLNADAVVAEHGNTIGWKAHVAGEIEEHLLPGNHTTLFRQDVKILTAQLRQCLERAVAECRY